jgi:parvulin-like peptidyl-prolyl isomerase
MMNDQAISPGPRRLRVLALSVASCIAIALAGCSGGGADRSEDDIAARVGDVVITKSDVDRVLDAKMLSQNQDPKEWGPPTFAGCIASRAAVPGSGGGDPRAVKAECKAVYDLQQSEAILLLINAEWIDREAARRGIELSDAAVKAIYRKQLRADRSLAEHAKLSLRSGLNEADLLVRVRLDELLKRLIEDTHVSAAEIADRFKNAPKEEFYVPEDRRVRLVLTRDQVSAAEAKAALQHGRSWFSVSKRYSTGEGARIGDATLAFMKGSFTHRGITGDKAFIRAVFRSPRGRVSGPVKGGLGWYVLIVDKVKPAVPPTLARAADQIKGVIQSQKLDRQLRTHYGDETTCAKEYQTPSAPDCLPIYPHPTQT